MLQMGAKVCYRLVRVSLYKKYFSLRCRQQSILSKRLPVKVIFQGAHVRQSLTQTQICEQVQPSAVAIVRVTGDQSFHIAQQLFKPAGHGANTQKDVWLPTSHVVEYGYVRKDTGKVIDEVLLLAFKKPRSFTGEDTIEFQCHGGISATRVLQAVLTSGARLALPGEFTQYAFLNGRLDLSQSESILDLITAQTSIAADAAIAGLSGGIRHHVESIRRGIMEILVEVEARNDFEDELDYIKIEILQHKLSKCRSQIIEALATAERGKLLRDGIQVALVGRPNVGKSSILNLLSDSERAIVTDVPGTTRDIVESNIILSGIKFIIQDTAGLREASDRVEQIGQDRAYKAASSADIILFVVEQQVGLSREDVDILKAVKKVKQEGTPIIMLVNKCDVAGKKTITLSQQEQSYFFRIIYTSALTAESLDTVTDVIIEATKCNVRVDQSNKEWNINVRQEEALRKADLSLEQVQLGIAEGFPLDCTTVDLRDAIMSLGEVNGYEISEEILSCIFSKFCIGK